MKKILILLLFSGVLNAQDALQPALQNYFNGLCCKTTPSGTAPTINYTKTTFSFTQGNSVNECPSTLTGTTPITVTVSPSLPSGLSINSTTGCITGTPTTSMSSTAFTFTATNAFGTGTDNVNIVVNASVTPVAPTIEYTQTAFAFNTTDAVNICPATLTGDAPITVTVSPSLPAGLTLNSSTGCITGTATATSANTSYTFTATNSVGTDTDVATIEVVNLGVITITGGLTNGHFTDLASAKAYVDGFTTVTATDVSLTGDVFRFTYPAGTSFSGAGFLSKGYLPAPTSSATIQDPLARIVEYGGESFNNNSGNNDFGANVSFVGIQNFQESTGNNTFGNGCSFSSDFQFSSGNNTFGNNCTFGQGIANTSSGNFIVGTNATFGNDCFVNKQGGIVTIGNGVTFGENAFFQYNGGIVTIGNLDFSSVVSGGNNMFQNVSNPITVNLTGNIGATEADDFGSDSFINIGSLSNITINALASKETSNSGGIEGDLANLINNGATVNFILP